MALSVSEAVGDAAKTAVENLALTGVTVVKRKNPSRPEKDGGLPEVVVSVGEFGAVEKIDAEYDSVRYAVAVTIVTAGGNAAGDTATAPPGGASAATVRQWLEQIRRKLQSRASWAGVPGWNAVGTIGRPPFDPAALTKGFNYATQTFTVEMLEAREE